jgi:hypothetical protein
MADDDVSTPDPGGSDEQGVNPQLIRGAVARVLSARELVINRGAEHGVQTGQYYEVLAPEGEDIEDPETHEPLGSVDRPKVAVRIVHVQPKLAIARTFRSRKRNVGGLGAISAFDQLFGPPKYQTEYDTFRSKPDTWENLSEAESFVQTGDPVRQTFKYDAQNS